MHHKQSERRLRERLKAWQTAREKSPSPNRERSSHGQVEPLKLAQRLEERRPARASAAASQEHEPRREIRSSAHEAEFIFRAGQVWRRPDRQSDFIVDFSDGEQIEVRWSLSREWGAPHILSVHELVNYVMAKNVRPDWPHSPG